MAGYNGFSMSNNAVDAYNNGEKPLSKWTKADILEAISDYAEENDLKINMDLLKKVSAKVIKSIFLSKSSWHHTSLMYNRTDFYSLDESEVVELTDDKINSLIEKSKQKEEKIEEAVETWECEYLVWNGSRKHPKATEECAIGEIKGNWFYLSNGSKKSINANGFKMIRKIEK